MAGHEKMLMERTSKWVCIVKDGGRRRLRIWTEYGWMNSMEKIATK